MIIENKNLAKKDKSSLKAEKGEALYFLQLEHAFSDQCTQAAMQKRRQLYFPRDGDDRQLPNLYFKHTRKTQEYFIG